MQAVFLCSDAGVMAVAEALEVGPVVTSRSPWALTIEVMNVDGWAGAVVAGWMCCEVSGSCSFPPLVIAACPSARPLSV